MTVKVGVIGVGMIGQDHIRRLTTVLSGAAVVAVADADVARAGSAAGVLSGARVFPTGEELIADAGVDAVLVCSWGPTHEQYVLAAIEAGKPVFCEKPLASTQDACLRILDAEVASGRRFVQVGFMRRYDAAYRALKKVVADGAIGTPLIAHCGHRNPEVPPHYTSDMAINDTAVHEIDVMRWLLDDEITAVTVLRPRQNSRAVRDLIDPLFVVFETGRGALVDVEVSVNIAYGYDIRCEVVGETGTAALADSGPPVVVREGGARRSPVPMDWRERFLGAYDTEFREWLDSVAAGGGGTGPSSWDGYAATAVADAALQSMASGDRVPVDLRDRPDFYDKAS